MSQITSQIMMIRPANFGFNTQTAENNSFQSEGAADDGDEVNRMAQAEFDVMVATLRSKGVVITVIEDTDSPNKPDAIFPNNWISFHEDGTVITYPMFAPNRRVERREDVISELEKTYKVNKRYSFEHYEAEEKFLEGTGSMIFDREHQRVFACLSDRTDITLLDKFCVLTGTKRVVFHSVDSAGMPIYHTNVMMAIGQDFAVICLESVPDPEEKAELLSVFHDSGKQIIDISHEQVSKYAGNMLQVQSVSGEHYLVMSQSAYDSLTSEQVSTLSKLTTILPVAIPTIEYYGGGSVRCMMAEVFLPLL